MRKTNRKFQFITGAVILSAYLMTSDLTTTLAGDINANEQVILNVVSGTFEYEGKTYRAFDDYIALAKSYLAMDEYDLTKEQCDQVIAKVYANVETGIANGYLYEVTDKTSAESQNGETAANTKEETKDSDEQGDQESTGNIQKETEKESDQTQDGKSKEDYAEVISELLTDTQEKKDSETVIKKTGFSLKKTVITGVVLISMLILDFIMAGKISPRVKKNEQNS